MLLGARIVKGAYDANLKIIVASSLFPLNFVPELTRTAIKATELAIDLNPSRVRKQC